MLHIVQSIAHKKKIVTDFENVLQMQRQLAANRDALAQGVGAAATALVDVWKAFAGPTRSPAAEEPHAESAESTVPALSQDSE